MPLNAASRLHNTLQELYNFVQDFGDDFVHGDEPVWKQYFHVESVEEVLPFVLEMLDQVREIESQIHQMFDAPKASLRLKYFADLRKTIAVLPYNKNLAVGPYPLSTQALYSLEIISHDLEDEPEITQDDIDTIKSTLNELFEMLKKAEINKKLRNWIMNWLSMIRRAIDLYQISGAKGLQEALFRIQGEADFFWPAFKEVEERSPTVFEKLIGLFDKVCKVSEITERGRKLLESPVAGYVGSFVLRRLGG